MSGANTGSSAGCNRGAAEGSGEFLVFVNDDVEVVSGWLEALVDTADHHPDVGAIGSLISLQGVIQEADSMCGEIVRRWDRPWRVGRGQPYTFLRRVDYCSACSLLNGGVSGRRSAESIAVTSRAITRTSTCRSRRRGSRRCSIRARGDPSRTPAAARRGSSAALRDRERFRRSGPASWRSASSRRSANRAPWPARWNGAAVRDTADDRRTAAQRGAGSGFSGSSTRWKSLDDTGYG